MVTSWTIVSCDVPTRGAASVKGVPAFADNSRGVVCGHDSVTDNGLQTVTKVLGYQLVKQMTYWAGFRLRNL